MAEIGSMNVKASDAMQHLTVTVRVVKDWRFRVAFALIKLAAWISYFAIEPVEAQEIVNRAEKVCNYYMQHGTHDTEAAALVQDLAELVYTWQDDTAD